MASELNPKEYQKPKAWAKLRDRLHKTEDYLGMIAMKIE
jgi:hypothetical protein